MTDVNIALVQTNPLTALMIAVIILYLLVAWLNQSWTLGINSNSQFYTSNEVNWGASPYVDFMKDDNLEDKYKWVNVDKPNLDDLIPEYNFKTGVVDYRFGDDVYDSDTALVSDTPMPVLNPAQLSNVAMVNNLPPPPAVTQVLVPAAQAPPTILSADQNIAMLPMGSPEQSIMLDVPSDTGIPPVILPRAEGFMSHFSKKLTYDLKSRM